MGININIQKAIWQNNHLEKQYASPGAYDLLSHGFLTIFIVADMISTLWVRPHIQSESSWLLLSTPSVFELVGITSQFVYKLSNNQSSLNWCYSFKNFYCFYKIGSSELFGSYFYFIKPQWPGCFSPLVQAFLSVVGMFQLVLWPLYVPFCLFISTSCLLSLLPPSTLRIRETPVMFSRHDKLCAIMEVFRQWLFATQCNSCL